MRATDPWEGPLPGWRDDSDVVVEVRAADAAARAARAVPGVVRLQPGVIGLLAQYVRQVWSRATGGEVPDVAGAAVTIDRGGPGGAACGVTVDLRLVVRLGHSVAAVATTVQDAVVAAVATEVALPVTQVDVHVVDVDLYGLTRCDPRHHDGGE